MDNKSVIECAGFYFIHNFDSGNLGHVEQVPTELIGKSSKEVFRKLVFKNFYLLKI